MLPSPTARSLLPQKNPEGISAERNQTKDAAALIALSIAPSSAILKEHLTVSSGGTNTGLGGHEPGFTQELYFVSQKKRDLFPPNMHVMGGNRSRFFWPYRSVPGLILWSYWGVTLTNALLQNTQSSFSSCLIPIPSFQNYGLTIKSSSLLMSWNTDWHVPKNTSLNNWGITMAAY